MQLSNDVEREIEQKEGRNAMGNDEYVRILCCLNKKMRGGEGSKVRLTHQQRINSTNHYVIVRSTNKLKQTNK